MTIIESIRLLNNTKGADKEYKLQIEDHEDGTYALRGFNGRRGGNLTEQPKCSGVEHTLAKKQYDLILKKKLADGYRVDADFTSGSATRIAERIDTGLRPQMLGVVEPYETQRLEGLLRDDAYGMQEKHDGERLVARNEDGTIVFANKNGLATTATPEIEKAIEALRGGEILDGEIVGGTYFVFDQLAQSGRDLRGLSFEERFAFAQGLPENNGTGTQAAPLVATRLFVGEPGKRHAFSEIRDRDAEGVVFKRLDAPYREKRSDAALKYKFWNSLSAFVTGRNEKNSVRAAVLDSSGREIPVGNVTVRAGLDPDLGDIIEIRYRIVSAPGGSLQQPTLLHIRTDVNRAECTVDQIVYARKGTPESAA